MRSARIPATMRPTSRATVSRRGVLSYATGVIMPETRYALFVLGVGAGFFIAMYEGVTMIAEAMP